MNEYQRRLDFPGWGANGTHPSIDDHTPNEITRAEICAMVSTGVPLYVICKHLRLSLAVIRKHYGDDIETALPLANHLVGMSIFNKAISEDHPHATVAAMYWLRTRGQWKETPTDINVNGPSGKKHVVITDPVLSARIYQQLVAGETPKEEVTVSSEGEMGDFSTEMLDPLATDIVDPINESEPSE